MLCSAINSQVSCLCSCSCFKSSSKPPCNLAGLHDSLMALILCNCLCWCHALMWSEYIVLTISENYRYSNNNPPHAVRNMASLITINTLGGCERNCRSVGVKHLCFPRKNVGGKETHQVSVNLGNFRRENRNLWGQTTKRIYCHAKKRPERWRN